MTESSLRPGSSEARSTIKLAFADQIIVSGANFIVGLLLARQLGAYEFGRFALIWLVIEFVGSLQFAAIIQPMMNVAPKQPEDEKPRYFGAVALQQALSCLLAGSAAALGAIVAGHLFADLSLAELAPPLFATIVAYHLHNFLRRYFFLRDRALVSVANDILRFAIQLAVVGALPWIMERPTASAAVWAAAGACALSTAVGVCHLGPLRTSLSGLRCIWERHWPVAKWLLPSAVMFWMTSQAFVLIGGVVLGAEATGRVKAALAITGTLNLLLLALENFAPAQAAKAWHAGGDRALRGYMMRLTVAMGGLLCGAVALLNIAPGALLGGLFGREYEAASYLIRWFSLAAAIYGMSVVWMIWAAAMEKTQPIFVSYIAGSAFTVVFGYPLVWSAGLEGVAVGAISVELIRFVVLWALIRRERRLIVGRVTCRQGTETGPSGRSGAV